LVRKNGSDGTVTVDFITLELDETEHTATADVHFEFTRGTIKFENGELTKTIKVKIIQPQEEYAD